MKPSHRSLARALAVALAAVALIVAIRWIDTRKIPADSGRPRESRPARIDEAGRLSSRNATVSSIAPAPVPVGQGAVDALSLEELARRLQSRDAKPNEAVLTFKTSAGMQDFLKRAAAAGLVVKGRLDALRSVAVAFDTLEKLRAELAAHGEAYASAGANFPVTIPGLPPPEQRPGGGDVPFGDALLTAIGAGPGVDRSGWGGGVLVAVLDSGIAAHPAFADGQVLHVDLVNDGQPFAGHGTAIASLIGGGVNGAQGLAPGAKILDVRIAGAGGESDSFLLARGIETALGRGAQVINISMGSYGDSPVVAQAVSDALQRGAIVIAAAGNDSAGTKNWPAAYPGVISVSGVDATGHIAYFSNSGDPTIAAPAVGIPSAFAENNKPFLATGDGTSQAAALVSGAAAAILARGGRVLEVLTTSARQVPATKHEAGAGMLFVPTAK